MTEPTAIEQTASWRRAGGFFLLVVVPAVHLAGGFFIVDFLLSGHYTWGRSLRTLAITLSNLVLAYEFVYRDLQTTHPEWPSSRLLKAVTAYSIIPFTGGVAAILILYLLT